MGKFEIFKSSRKSQYYFRLKAGNGEIILGSEGYVSKQGCQNGIQSVKDNSPHSSNYEKKDGTVYYTFNLKAGNGEIIGRSENYTSKHGRDGGIESVKKNAPSATTTDLT